MTTNNRQVLLVADDGPDYGLGHLRRMEYLRDEIERSTEIGSAILSREQHVARTSSRGENRIFWRNVCDVVAKDQPSLCVFDLKFSSWSDSWDPVVASLPPYCKTIGIDVPSEWIEKFDYVIHPGVAGLGLSASPSNWHGGPAWTLVAREPRWNPAMAPPRVTITTGSQSFEKYFGWLGEILTALTDEGMEVSWVVGKHFEDQVADLNSLGSSITYVSDAKLSERFITSSAVLTRFGVTAFELAARGVPTIILPRWTDAESREILELARAGVVLVANTAKEVSQMAHRLATDRDLQKRLSEKARDFFGTASPHPAVKLISEIVSRMP